MKKISMTHHNTVPPHVDVYPVLPPKKTLKVRLRKIFGGSQYSGVTTSDVVFTFLMWFIWAFCGASVLFLIIFLLVMLQVWFFVIAAIAGAIVLFVRWFPKYLNS